LVSIGFDLAANRDFPCSRRFSSYFVRSDSVTRRVCRYCLHRKQKVFFWSCFAALNAGQSGPTRRQSGAAAEAWPELFQQVHFLVFDLRTVRDSTTDSPPFFFLARSELFLVVLFLGVERRTDSPALNPGQSGLPTANSLGLCKLCCFLSFLRALVSVGSRLIRCTSWSSPKVPSHPLAYDHTVLLCVSSWVVILGQRLKVSKEI
jgi:hypothetical protein